MASGFDPDPVFDEDYLHFYAARLDDAASDADVARIAALGALAPGDRVLDLACGHGRLANRLAARGARVTGLDRSAAFLARARADAARLGVDVDYVEADVRAMPGDGRFDLVVCWFTSFGYLGDAEDRRVLRGIHAALRPGGRVLLELNHAPALLRGFLPCVAERLGDDLMVTEHRYEALTGRLASLRTVVRGGRVRSFAFSNRLFAFPELRDWLEEAGFGEVEGFGPGGAPLTGRDRRMIVRAVRPAD
ncbi:MAG: class I SAM-dependent methyltransferase [Myxococcota bacterium]|nr:class I SAM-dependent methyltransferase [Myxococcota bacterium]